MSAATDREARSKDLTVQPIRTGAWLVDGGERPHVVADGVCDCADHRIRKERCKHLLAVERYEKQPPVAAPLQLIPTDGWEPATEDDLDDVLGYDDADGSSFDETPDELFPIVRLLEGDAPEPAALLVSDLLMDRDINLFHGPGGNGKSTIVETIAVCVALGLPVFGSLAVTRPGNVLMVLTEDGQANARMMMDAIIAGMNLGDEAQAACMERIAMVSEDVIVNLTTDAQKLGATALAHEAVLVIVDPLGSALGGAPENDNTVPDQTYLALRRDVCRAADCAALITGHDRKPSKDSSGDARYEARGAGGWINGARLAFQVKKRDQQITLTCSKANRVRSDINHELTLSIEADPGNKAHWTRCTVADANAGTASEALTPGKGRPLNRNEQAALSCLDDTQEPGKRLSWSAWIDQSELKANTLKSVKRRLVEAGLVAAINTGRKARSGGSEYAYEITPEGRTVLVSGWTFERRGEGVR